jgi:hypothetical protein
MFISLMTLSFRVVLLLSYGAQSSKSAAHPQGHEEWKQLEQLVKTTSSFYGGQLPADLETGRSCARTL